MIRELTGKEKIKKWIYLFCVSIICFLFFFCLGNKGTQYYKDSATYIRWSYPEYGRPKGYMVYPFLIRIIRYIHGENNYQVMVYIYQGILSLLVDVLLIEYIRKVYKIGYIVGLLLHILLLTSYSFTLPEAVSSHYIATESICIPLYLLAVFFLLKFYIEMSSFSLVAGLTLLLFMCGIRPQLVAVFLINLALCIVFFIYRYNNLKPLFKRVIILSSVVLCICVSYILFLRMLNKLADSDNNSQFAEAMAGKALCLLEEDDRAYFDGYEQEIYDRLYIDGKENLRLYDNFPESIVDYEKIHVIINENVTAHETIIWDYFIEKTGDAGGDNSIRVRNKIISKILNHHKTGFWRIVFRLMPSSLVASIFIQPESIREVCYLIAIVFYAISALIIIFSVIRNIGSIYITPFVCTIITIVANSFACNIILYGQQRYVIYCMGIFYVFGFVLARELIRSHRPEGIHLGE